MQSPGQQASGEVESGQARSNDVSDAEVGRADGGGAEGGCAAGGDDGRSLGAAELQSEGERGNVDQDFLAGVEDVDRSGEEDSGADAHVGEENLGGARALLSGLVNLRGGNGFREGQLGVFDHDAGAAR